MKTRIVLSVLSVVVLLTGIAFAISVKSNRPSLTINDILRTYKIPQTPDALATYVVQARKLTHYAVEPGSDLPGYVELMVTVAVDKDQYRREKVGRQGQWRQIDLSNSQETYRAELQQGNLVGGFNRLNDTQFQAAQSATGMFGLIPVLKQLEAGGGEAVSLGVTKDGGEKFSVKNEDREWILSVDSERLIRRLQLVHNSHHVTIDYADYRSVAGIQLPYIERVSVDGSLLYEMFFTRMDLNPSLPADYFSLDALTREYIR